MYRVKITYKGEKPKSYECSNVDTCFLQDGAVLVVRQGRIDYCFPLHTLKAYTVEELL